MSQIKEMKCLKMKFNQTYSWLCDEPLTAKSVHLSHSTLQQIAFTFSLQHLIYLWFTLVITTRSQKLFFSSHNCQTLFMGISCQYCTFFIKDKLCPFLFPNHKIDPCKIGEDFAGGADLSVVFKRPLWFRSCPVFFQKITQFTYHNYCVTHDHRIFFD